MATGYELPNFDLFEKAALYKMEEEGLPNDITGFMQVVKDWGLILTNETAVQQYVDAVEAAKHAQAVADAQAALDALTS